MLRILFAHPLVQAVTGWDFADGAWLNAPSGLVRADNSPKPVYRLLRHLIHDEWTSRGVIHTDDNGVAELEGFRGQYCLQVGRSQGTVILSAQGTAQPQRVILQIQDC